MARKIENLPDVETLERLGRARDFIDHCYDHPLSLDQISEKACFSKRQVPGCFLVMYKLESC